MKLKKAKKGFTLVELVVVIAIIAVLSTVSVVGYLGFTKKANVSGDKALVSQLNTILKADQATNGKAETPTEAIEAVKESGYLVEKLAAKTSKYKIVWNQKDNEFALLDEEEKAVAGKVSSNAYENWVFADSYNAEEGYSVYLNSGYSGNSTLDITTGLDVGENASVEVVNYTKTTEAKDVTIRTNGGTLNIDADTDSVRHYSLVDSVNIASCAMSSYHEYGNVEGNISVEKGHVKLESGSSVNSIAITASSVNDIAITQNENAVIEKTIIAVNESVRNELLTSENIKVDNSVKEKTQDIVFLGNDVNASNFIEKVSTGKYTVLTSDIDLNSSIQFETKNVDLDLNGHTLKLNSYLNFEQKSDAKIANGTIELRNPNQYSASTTVKNQSKLIMTNISYLSVKGSGIFPDNKSEVIINSSKVVVKGYGLGTNASNSDVASPALNISITNSEIIASDETSHDNTALYINVPAVAYFENTKFVGDRQSVFVRGSTATFKNCELISKALYSNMTQYYDSDWASGNEVPATALTIGNRSTSAYDYPTTVTLIGTKLTVESTNKDVCALYAYGLTKSDYAVTISYDKDSQIGRNNLKDSIGNVVVNLI